MIHRTYLIAVICALVLAACSGGDDKPAVTELGQDAVGTCLDVDETVGAEINELPVAPCGEKHTHEIYAVLDSASDVYPGFKALEEEAQVACLTAFEPYVGISPFDSNLFYSWLVPTLASWEDKDIGKQGDREIICVVGSADDEPLEESVKGSRR